MQKGLRVGITGKSGFVGTHFFERNSSLYEIVNIDLRVYKANELDLSGIDTIVHFAGLAHQMNGAPAENYFKINVGLTEELIQQAAAQGVKQFIYISSTKVYGEETDEVLNENSACKPLDPYGQSKLAAEMRVLSYSNEVFQVAVVRPPMVYGAGVKGNTLRLMHLAQKNLPLPFGKIKNLRSMVYVHNLGALINTIIDKKASGVFLAADKEPVSTEVFVSLIQQAFHHKEKLFSLPVIARKMIKLMKPQLYSRLFRSYVIDNTATRQSLDFSPPYTVKDGITEMVSWFKQHNSV